MNANGLTTVIEEIRALYAEDDVYSEVKAMQKTLAHNEMQERLQKLEVIVKKALEMKVSQAVLDGLMRQCWALQDVGFNEHIRLGDEGRRLKAESDEAFKKAREANAVFEGAMGLLKSLDPQCSRVGIYNRM